MGRLGLRLQVEESLLFLGLQNPTTQLRQWMMYHYPLAMLRRQATAK